MQHAELGILSERCAGCHREPLVVIWQEYRPPGIELGGIAEPVKFVCAFIFRRDREFSRRESVEFLAGTVNYFDCRFSA